MTGSVRWNGCDLYYVLEHHARPRECGVVLAAFKGHDSPLRRTP